MDETIYNWIAQVSRLIPNAVFKAHRSSIRDGRTRIEVSVGSNEYRFVIFSKNPDVPAYSPVEVSNYFKLLKEPDVQKMVVCECGNRYVESFFNEPLFMTCFCCGRSKKEIETYNS